MNQEETLRLAEELYNRARPGEGFHPHFCKTQRYGDYVVVIIPIFDACVTDSDGRQFGTYRTETVIGAVSADGAVYEGIDGICGLMGSRWSANFTRYEFTEILKEGDMLVLSGSRVEYSQYYDERRCFQGGWVATREAEHPIRLELKQNCGQRE